MNTIPGDLSNMNLPGLNETSIDLKIQEIILNVTNVETLDT